MENLLPFCSLATNCERVGEYSSVSFTFWCNKLIFDEDLYFINEGGFFNPGAEDTINPSTPKQQKRGPKPKESHFKSQGEQVTPRMHQRACSPLKRMVSHAALSPMKISCKLHVDDIFSSSDSEDDFESEDSWAPDSDDSEDYDDRAFHAKKESLSSTQFYNKRESMTYLGIPAETFFVVDMMAEYINYKGHA